MQNQRIVIRTCARLLDQDSLLLLPNAYYARKGKENLIGSDGQPAAIASCTRMHMHAPWAPGIYVFAPDRILTSGSMATPLFGASDPLRPEHVPPPPQRRARWGLHRVLQSRPDALAGGPSGRSQRPVKKERHGLQVCARRLTATTHTVREVRSLERGHGCGSRLLSAQPHPRIPATMCRCRKAHQYDIWSH